MVKGAGQGTGQGKAEPGSCRDSQGRTGQGRAGHDVTGQSRAGQGMARQGMAGQDRAVSGWVARFYFLDKAKPVIR